MNGNRHRRRRRLLIFAFGIARDNLNTRAADVVVPGKGVAVKTQQAACVNESRGRIAEDARGVNITPAVAAARRHQPRQCRARRNRLALRSERRDRQRREGNIVQRQRRDKCHGHKRRRRAHARMRIVRDDCRKPNARAARKRQNFAAADISEAARRAAENKRGAMLRTAAITHLRNRHRLARPPRVDCLRRADCQSRRLNNAHRYRRRRRDNSPGDDARMQPRQKMVKR